MELLVNNAVTFPRVPLLEMTDAQWSTVLEVNLADTFRRTQLVELDGPLILARSDPDRRGPSDVRVGVHGGLRSPPYGR